MSSTRTVAAEAAPGEFAAGLDSALEELASRKYVWAQTSIDERLDLLAKVKEDDLRRRPSLVRARRRQEGHRQGFAARRRGMDVQSPGCCWRRWTVTYSRWPVSRYAPFRPFPRNLLHGSMILLPRPPWFVTNRRADNVDRRLVDFQYQPSWLKPASSCTPCWDDRTVAGRLPTGSGGLDLR
jgi:hypothetical protein